MKREQFNDNWLFKKGSVESLQSQLRPSGDEGEMVHLPHDAMILEERDENTVNSVQTGFYPGGDYTYKKKILVPEEWKEKLVTLEFEGVYTNAKVFINGTLATVSNNGYATFYVDTTSYFNYGEENEIKVTVNNTAIPNSRWYSGSGIYRPVTLITANLIHFGLNGVKITTPEIDEDSAIVQIDSVIDNKLRLNEKTIVQAEIINAAGEVVAISQMPVNLLSDRTTEIRHRMLVENPKLWDCETPHLYTCKLQIIAGEKVWDSEEISFGIRELKLDAKKGFRINGKTVKLRGACVHHDNGILGAATFDQAEERRVLQLKEAGFNSIRSSHQPISKAILEACDKYGVLVIDELSDMWTQAKNLNDYSEHFLRNWEQDTEMMVAKCFNHPSVIMYCMGNEIQELGTAHGAELNRKINVKLHELDPTRFTTNAISGWFAATKRLPEIIMDLRSKMSGSSPSSNSERKVSEGGSNEVNSMMSMFKGPFADALAAHPIMTETIGEVAATMDVVGLNYLTGRHLLEAELDDNRVVLGTETYPGDIARLWEIVENNAHMLGDMTWTGYDYLGEAGIGIFYYDGKVPFAKNWPDSVAYVGDIDITGYRRPVSYYREIVFGLRKEPYIAVQRVNRYGTPATATLWHFKDSISSWTWDGYEGKPAIIDVFADADEVELFLNDVSLGRKVVGETETFITTFELTYEPGTLRAVAYKTGEVDRVDVLETSDKKTTTFNVQVDKQQLSTCPNDLSYIEIQLVDGEGRPNKWDQKEISIEAEGEVVIQGFGSADPQTDNYYNHHTWKTYDGRLLAVIRSSGNAGAGKVTLKMGDVAQTFEFTVSD